MTIRLYGFGPTRSVRAKWALQEAGLPYEAAGGFEATRDEAYQRIHPLAKLPALIHDGRAIFESVAIVNYIGALVPEKKFVPTEPFARALYDQWSCFALAELEAWLWSNAKHQTLYPEAKRVPAVVPANQEEFAKAAAVVDRHLADRPYILGDAFTFADINLGYTLNWGRCVRALVGLPNVDAYLKRLNARPACALQDQTEFFKKVAVAVSFEGPLGSSPT